MEKIFGFIGGDRRQLYAARCLKEKGYKVKVFLMDECGEKYIQFKDVMTENISEIKKCNHIILPLPIVDDDGNINSPFSSDRIQLSQFVDKIDNNTYLYGGKITKADFDIFKNLKHTPIDYVNRDDFKILNAIPTAEGCLSILINEHPKTIFGSKTLITGYGKVGKAIAIRMKSLGSDVTIVARKTIDKEFARADGMSAVGYDNLKSVCRDKDFVINTVPHKVFGEKELILMDKQVLVVDLASKPGGVDMGSAIDQGIDVIWALAIPGKTAHITAGEIISMTILNIIDERGE